MSYPPFLAPDVGAMNRLLPAFEFITCVTSDGRRAVYLVNQRSLDRKAAIKVYSPALSASEDFRTNFGATAKQMARVRHNNLIGVYDSGVVRQMLYLVTEFVPGKPLWNSTKGDAIEMIHVSGLIKGIAEGICHAHRNGVHHGALSLTNILLNKQRTPKIGGFSQANAQDRSGDGDSRRFRAPELLGDASAMTAQADIYSMGMILRELAIGKDEQDDKRLIKIEGGSPALHALWSKATREDPHKRHASAEEFKEDLSAALEGKRGGKLALGVAGAGRKPGGKLGGKLGPGRPGAQRPATSSPKPPPKAPSGASMVLKVVIILALLMAIQIVWSAYRSKKERQQREQEAARSAPQASRVVRLKRPPTEPRHSENKPSEPWDPSRAGENSDDASHPNRFERPREDGVEALAPLRQALRNGSRSSFPRGTVASGDHHFFFVNVPMTWTDAFWFAMDHGAHLAVPGGKSTVGWMSEEVVPSGEDSYWLGAAKSGRDLWTLADGRPWQITNPALNRGDFLGVVEGETLQSFNAAAEMGFVIQWNRNGKNAGSLDALLEKTRVSLGGTAAVYPPGTQTFGVRRYLYVPRPVAWRDAVLTARSAGAHLVVATSIAENFHMEKMTKGLDAPDGIWIGGFHLAGKGWRWTTGEPWRSTDWPQDKTTELKEAALALLPGGEWTEMPRDALASGFIIEWSPDSESAK